MSRRLPLFALALAAFMAGCPAPGTPTSGASPSITPSSGATAQPSGSPGASTAPVPSPTASVQTVAVGGNLYDDNGVQIQNGTVTIRSTDDPSLNQTISAYGGSYGILNVPVGAAVSITASAPGMTTRTRLMRPVALTEADETSPNQIDFGGTAGGILYALSKYPEIDQVTPANQATGVSAMPLKVSFHFSVPLSAAAQSAFSSLLQLKFQSGTTATPAPGQSGETTLAPGTAYDTNVATLSWDAAGQTATFEFDGPIVTENANGSAVTVNLNQSVALSAWPQVNGVALGYGVAPITYDGNGAAVTNKIAAFARNLNGVTTPSAPATGLTLWGMTHTITTTFALTADTTPPHVVSVVGNPGVNGGDQIIVTFDQPMRGFPEVALDGSAIRQSNYRFVLGKRDKPADSTAFDNATAEGSGQTAPLQPIYSTTDPHVIILPCPAGFLGSWSDIKLYVDPSVKDIAGVGVSTAPNPATGTAGNLAQGKV